MKKKKVLTLEVPDKIKIGRATWRIYQEPELPEKWKEPMDNLTMRQHGLMGITHPNQREIHLAKECGEGPELPRTFIHELLHAILAENGPHLPCDFEEQIVASLERPLYEILRRCSWR